MEEQGSFSLWIGQAETAEAFHQFLQMVFTEDGDASSDFCDAFGIDFYDEDFQEAEFRSSLATELPELLEGVSYPVDLGAISIPPCNCFVLLFNFSWTGDVGRTHSTRSLSLTFVGHGEYQED